jgi:hypothetical protein
MKLLFYFILVTAFLSCGSNEDRKDGFSEMPKSTEDSLFQEVMDAHDAAMAKMGRLAAYREQIQHELDSLKKVKPSKSAATKQSLQDLENQVRSAEDGMNTWMQEFSIDSAQDDITKRIQYLSSEKQKVTKVKEQVLAAAANADSLLKK